MTSQRKTVLFAERDIQSIVGRRGLQFEIERTAETFAKREAPGFVNAATEGRVDDKLHARRFRRRNASATTVVCVGNRA